MLRIKCDGGTEVLIEEEENRNNKNEKVYFNKWRANRMVQES